MPQSVHLLDPNLGIQGFLTPQETEHMPEARPLAPTMLRQVGVEQLYQRRTTDQYLEEVLAPEVGDGTLVAPNVFNDMLTTAFETLKDNPNPSVKNLVSGELAPLLENKALLSAYVGLLVGG